WEWLNKYHATAYVTDITNVKPQNAFEFVDDRGVTFSGWTPEFLESVRTFQPYWKATRQDRTLFILAKRSFDSIHYNLDPADAARVLAIPVSDDAWAEKGRELHPHVTVLYGLKDVDEDTLRQA